MDGMHQSALQLCWFFLQLLLLSLHTNSCWFWRQLSWWCLCQFVCNIRFWHKIAFNQQHLSLDQQCDLFTEISTHNKLFGGFLGVYPHKKVLINLKPWGMPVHHYPYPVPYLHQQTFKKCLTTWSNLVSFNYVGPLNGHSLPSLLLKRMCKLDKLWTYAPLTKQ